MDRLAVGKIGTSHGVRGYLKAVSFSGETGHLLKLKEVVLRKGNTEKVVQVEEVKPFGKGILIKLAGVDSPEVARRYCGYDIWVERNQAAKLGADEFYINDLCQCEMVKDGVVLGKVQSVAEGGYAEFFEVVTPTGKFIVPFIKEYIGEVDIKNRTIELIADWLLS